MVKKVPLQNGEFVLVDDEDYERVMEHKWYLHQAFKNSTGPIENKNVGQLTRFLKPPKSGDNWITFKNGNQRDFRKDNLIEVERAQRIRGKRGNGGSSKYKGVSWDKETRKWRALIKVNGARKNLGRFSNEDEAARAYNAAAIEAWGDDAYLNIIGEDNNFTKIKADYKGLNAQKRSENSNGFKGVYKNQSYFGSRITARGNYFYLGMFKKPEQAAEAYDRKAYEIYGDEAILNFPEKAPDYAKEVKLNAIREKIQD